MGATDEVAAFLEALDELEVALDETVGMVEAMKGRCRTIKEAHDRGIPLRELVPREQTPLLVQLLTEATNVLHAYGNRVRRTEAKALYEEGMTMEEIARLFGVTRQRVSALLRAGRGQPG